MRKSRFQIAVWWAAAVAVGWSAIQQIRSTWAYGAAADPASSSDALPLFLGARAVRLGYDPTNPSDLQYLYEYSGMNVSKALFSVLYPASFHVMLQPLSDMSWFTFMHYWRQVLLVGLVMGVALAGTVGVERTRAPFAAALSVWASFVLFPLFASVQLGLGQPNLLIVGLFGMAMAFAARGWAVGAGAVAVIGAGVKLVPAVALWPLFWTRRWRSLGVIAGLGGLLAGITLVHVPLDRVLDNLQATFEFQRSVEPHWLYDQRLPDWASIAGFLRRPSLAIMSFALSAWAVWRLRGDKLRQGEAVAVSIALLSTALAADSCGVGAYYATMAIPGMVAVLTWPLAVGASRISWLVLPTVLGVVALTDDGLIYNTPNVEPRLVVACIGLWAATAIRLGSMVRPWPVRVRIIGTLMVLAAVIHASIWTWRPPYGGPKSLPSASPGSMTTPMAPPVAPTPVR
ncbi:MAG: glycosyltransferase family 87 protein [Myxococcota bacterium]